MGNFFSLVLQGERPLVQGLVHRLYSKKSPEAVSEYLHHFVDEENKHMVMFGMFCRRYLGKIYPEKKVLAPAKLSKDEEEIVFYCKVLVVEELGDYFNVFMQKDERLHPIVRELNRVHHIDESRHLAFGRAAPEGRCARSTCPRSREERRQALRAVAARLPGIVVGRLLQPDHVQGRRPDQRVRAAPVRDGLARVRRAAAPGERKAGQPVH